MVFRSKKLSRFFFFIFVSCIAQQNEDPITEIKINGTIISSVNNKPLSDVIVSFDSKNKGATTNSDGKFSFIYEKRRNDSIEKVETIAIGYIPLDTIIKVDRNLNLSILLKPNKGIDRSTAQKHLEDGEVNILLSSGIAPVSYYQDKSFTEKYGVNFIEFGCEAIAEESLSEYNKIVFEHLDIKYGKKWRKEIRKDIVGLNIEE